MTTELTAREAPARYAVEAQPAIPKGYKQTEVGVLPEDWGAVNLGSLTVLMTNGFVGTATRHYAPNDNGVLYIQGYNVEENSFNFHGIKYVTDEFHKAHAKSCLRGGDLLTVQTGDVGLTTVVPDYLAGSNCHALIISRFDKQSVSPIFISYYLNSFSGRSRLRLIETGTTMKHLNVGDMLEFYIPLPPTKAEQEAIAEALSDADALIEALEQIIAKKRQLKQGAMQELLTGKKRLPGFGGEWEEKQIGEVADLLKGSGLSKNSVTASGQRKCILYGELFTTYGQVIHDVVGRTDSKDGRPSVWGDVLVPGSTTTDGIDLATASALFEDGVALGGDINIIRFWDVNHCDSTFFANYLTHVKKQEIAERAQGTTIVHLYGRDLSDLSVQWPSFAEQTAIATLLSDMDAELAALEAQLAKARGIKQGMMQELLTGRIRLV